MLTKREVLKAAGVLGLTATAAPQYTLARTAGAGLTVARALVEWREQANGIDTLRPRFNWTLAAPPTARNKRQTAVGLRITDHNARTIFDSGKMRTSALRFRPSSDLPLQSQGQYRWFLTVWDEHDTSEGEVSTGSFTTGLVHADAATAHWIAAQPQGAPYVQPTWANHPDTPPNPPLPIFRKAFTPAGKPETAVLSIAGLGQYQLFLDGKPVSPNAMNGAWTDYAKRVLYDTYDVSNLVTEGENWLAVELGNGFFNVEGNPERYRKYVSRYGPPQLWLQLRLTYADGAEAIIISDDSWQTREGPTVFTSIYGGEDYDARDYIDGWREGKGANEGWQVPHVLAGPGGRLHAHNMTPMKSCQRLEAAWIAQPRPGIHVYDCGTNHSGRPMVHLRGLKAGTTVTLHPAELLGTDGLVDQSSMTRWAEHATNIQYTFISAGAAEETWEPAFTYNGYRYLQVEGVEPSQITLASNFLTDDFAQCGTFNCSDDRLNRIHGLIKQAVLSNAASYLTDCPDREKLGWLEQTYLNADTILMNIDGVALYEKMAADITDAQLPSGMVPSFAPEYLRFVDANEVDSDLRNIPEWASSVVLTPWAAYGLYGNIEILAATYPAMQKYAAYILTRVNANGLVGYGIGDWYDFGPNPPGPAQLTSLAMTNTATLCYVFRCLSHIATLLGEPGAESYAARSESFRAAILEHLYNPQTHQFDRGSQTANAMALALDIAPMADRQAVLDNLIADIRARQDHVSAGDVGFHYVVRALSLYGRGDVLYAMLRRDDKPSYGEQLANGATSLTEAWDGERISSQNHFMLGHIESWFYRGLGGIDVNLGPDAKQAITIAPDWMCGLNGAKVRYTSVFGTIASDWRLDGKTWRLSVQIPVGTAASIRLPDGRQTQVGSGKHDFAGNLA